MTIETNQIKLMATISTAQMEKIIELEESPSNCCLYECLRRLDFVRDVQYEAMFGNHIWIDIMAEDDCLKIRQAILAQIQEYLEDENV